MGNILQEAAGYLSTPTRVDFTTNLLQMIDIKNILEIA
jgi:hypothetical protein